MNNKELINNLQEDYCSFEVSKLLKEKGFDVECYDCFNSHGMLYSNGWCEAINDKDVDIPFNHHSLNLVDLVDYTLKPTHSLAIKWIKENYSSDKIKHLSYEISPENIDEELRNILQNI